MSKISSIKYFKQRLINSGYIVDEVFRKFSQNDPRSWMLIIDPGVSSIVCTCYINSNDKTDYMFELYDGGQFIPGFFKIKTASIEVIIENLVKFGINNKNFCYNDTTTDST